MKKGVLVGIIVIAILITAGFFVFGIYMFASQSEYRENFIYYYTPEDAQDTVNFDAYASVSQIRIQYNTSNTDQAIKAEMMFHFRGPMVEGQSYTEYYKPIVWENTTDNVRFSLESKTDSWTFPTNWFGNRNTTLTLTLRTDIDYNLNTTADIGSITFNGARNNRFNVLNLKSTTGSINVNLKDNTVIQGDANLKTTTGSIDLFASNSEFEQDLTAESTTGGINLNFTSCNFGGNIQGILTTGSIDYKSYNAYYNKDIDLTLETTTGRVDIDMIQYNEMGANVSSTISTTTGGISINYKDNRAEVGAYFEGVAELGEVNFPGDGNGFIEAGTAYFSEDYPNTYNYEFSMSTDTGSIDVVGESN